MSDYEYWGNNLLGIHENMAIEEYLLARSAETGVSTVRFWNVPKDAIVLGYGEHQENVKKIDGTFDLERRITGGSHIQFGPNCLAYSFTVPRDGRFKDYEDMRRYYAAKVADALQNLGIGVSKVDNKSSTINVDEKVVASHSIFWGVKSALLHGLVVVDDYDVDRIYERVILKERKIGKNIYREYDALKSIPAVSHLLKNDTEGDKTLKIKKIKAALANEMLKEVTRGSYSYKTLSENVVNDAARLVKATHANEEWINYRKPPYTYDTAEAIPGEKLNGTLKKDLGYCLYIQVKDSDFKKMAEPYEG